MLRVVAPTYRPDIDGLRAVAVLLVLAYHLGVKAVSGGFIGVDVFFVISGFLITSQLVKELQSGTFSLSKFYERRVRRLLPALIVMLSCTVFAGYWILYPLTYIELGKSLIAAALSVSNIFFWLHSDYFDAPANTRPLLHTWSLGVEEQFYLLCPAFLLLMWRKGLRTITTVLALVLTASLLLSVVGAFKFSSASFYLLPTRLWELMLGSLLALGVCPNLPTRLARNTIGLIGLGLIVGCALWIDKYTPFPGATALMPCIGAAMVISAGFNGPNAAAIILSRRPVVMTGLLSYSLYLWHWPVIILYQNYYGVKWLDLSSKVIIAVASIGLAFLSWRYVERPFRSHSTNPSLNLRALAVAGSTAVAVAAFVIVGQGFPTRFKPEVVQMAAYLSPSAGQVGDTGTIEPLCFLHGQRKLQDFDAAVCLAAESAKRHVLVIGDSHAKYLVHGIRNEWSGFQVSQATAAGCRPTMRHALLADKTCVQLMTSIYGEYLPRTRPDLIVLSGRWRYSDLEYLAETLRWLRDQQFEVILAGPTVEYEGAVPQLVALSMQHDKPELPDSMIKRDIAMLDERLAELASAHDVDYFSMFRAFCPDGFDCNQLSADHVPYQFDYGHLTRVGSVFVARSMIQQGIVDLRTAVPENIVGPGEAQ